MKSIWKGYISFGLVNIPVRMYSGSQSHTLDLDMLRKKDHCPIKFKRVCGEDEKEVPYNEIVKGYEFNKGEYVILEEKDFESARIEKSSNIDLVHFVDSSEVEPVYFEKPYFLEPDKAGAKPYSLLREAILKSKKIGIAKFVMKNREHIGVINVYNDIIVLNQIRYADEVRKPTDLKIPETKTVNQKELDIALTLIKQMSSKFKPSEFKDTYINDLKKIIEQKAKGKKIKRVIKSPKPETGKSIMTLLKASIKKKAA